MPRPRPPGVLGNKCEQYSPCPHPYWLACDRGGNGQKDRKSHVLEVTGERFKPR